MVDRRQTHTCELRESSRLIPTHPCNGIILLTLRKASQFPGGRTRPTREVTKFCDGLSPRDFVAFLQKSMFPELPILVATVVDKSLELFVRHFVFVHPVVLQLDGLQSFKPRKIGNKRGLPGRYAHHAGWDLPDRV